MAADPAGGGLEDLVARAWEEVLGVPGINRDADFLDLGGDSLHAVRIVGRIEEDLDIHLSIRAILEARTVRLMTARVAAARAAQAEP